MEGSYYISFLTIVQLAVAFCLGMIFMDRNSSIVKFQSSIFDNLRKNRLASFIMNYAGELTRRIRTNSVERHIAVYREELNALKDKYRAALDTERTCSYMASIGTVAGFYSIGWLIYVPYYVESSDTMCIDSFLTYSLATIVSVFIIVVIDLLSKLPSSRVACAACGFVLWILSLLVARRFYANELAFNVTTDTKILYAGCVAICFMPIWALLLRITYDIFRRVLLIARISKMTLVLKLWKDETRGFEKMIKWRCKNSILSYIVRFTLSLVSVILTSFMGLAFYLYYSIRYVKSNLSSN